MRGFVPRRPTGSTPEALFDQAIWDRVFGGPLNFNNSTTVKFDKTTRGITAHAKPPKSSAATPPTKPKPYLVTDESDDFLTCEPWNWLTMTTTGDPSIDIAKPWLLRRSAYDGKTKTLLDGTHTYSYQDHHSRHDTLTGIPAYLEKIFPEYLIRDTIIYAEESDTGLFSDAPTNLKPITFRDVNDDGRTWAYLDSACVSGVQKKIYVVGSKPFGIYGT